MTGAPRSAHPRSGAPPGAGGGGFPRQPVQPGRRRHRRPLAGLAACRLLVVVAPARAGKTHLANVWRLKSGAAASRGRRAERGGRGPRRRRAAGRGPARRHRRRARPVPPAQPRARAQAVDAADLARAAGRARGHACPTCARACARCRSSPSRRPTRPCSRRCWSSISPTGSSPWSRTSSATSRCTWSSPWRPPPTIVAEIDRLALASHRKVTRALAAEVAGPAAGGGSRLSRQRPPPNLHLAVAQSCLLCQASGIIATHTASRPRGSGHHERAEDRD